MNSIILYFTLLLSALFSTVFAAPAHPHKVQAQAQPAVPTIGVVKNNSSASVNAAAAAASSSQPSSAVSLSSSSQSLPVSSPSTTADAGTDSESSQPEATPMLLLNNGAPSENGSVVAALNQTRLNGQDPKNSSRLLHPDDDPFYDAPENVTNYKLGDIIRYRRIDPPSLFNDLDGNMSAAYQVLFRSEDSHDCATAGMTTILVPHKANVTQLLSYQNIEDASASKCAASYVLRKKKAGFDVEKVEFTFLQSALNQGWVVNVPDYEGQESAFTAGIRSGKTTLDSIRAVLNFGNLTGIHEPPTIAMWGYSGGTIGTVFAAEIQPSYAPDLTISGAAAGGITPNLTQVATRINKSVHVGIAFSALHGLSAEYPEFKKAIQDDLKENMTDDYMKARNMCLDEVAFYNEEDWSTYFKSGESLLNHTVVKEIMDKNAMGQNGTPKIPMFWYDGPQDDIGDYDTIKDLYDQFCHDGASILLHEDLTARHTPLAVLGSKDAFSWLIDVLSGKDMAQGCKKQTFLTNSLTPGALDVFGQELGRRIANIFPNMEDEDKGDTAL